jgi:predicted HAD superfamily phosphohydrolase YqeG
MIPVGARLREEYPHLPNVLPDYTANTVLEVDFSELNTPNVLLDLDLTIRRAYATEIEEDIVSHLAEQRDKGLIGSISLATNSGNDLSNFANQLDANVFQPFTRDGEYIRKPSATFFNHILSELGAAANTVVMIGDRYQLDIIGANQIGITTVTVEPLGRDYLPDRLLLTRYRDNRALRLAERLLRSAQTDH